MDTEQRGAVEPLIVVGGALRTAEAYAPLARALRSSWTVHMLARRGRPGNEPLPMTSALDVECDDLAALAEATGATAVFGHSYGGLLALETVRRHRAFDRVVLYEPGVSIDGSVPSGWLDGYAARLARGDRRGAFAHFVRHAGGAPPALTKMPEWYLRAVLRLAVRGRRWAEMEPLLEANLVEHREVVRLDGDGSRYRDVGAAVHLIAGARSPARQTASIRRLAELLPCATLTVLDGLDHFAPDEKAPDRVAMEIGRALGTVDESRA